jgi:hypothetical protein
MKPSEDRNVTAPIVATELRVWACLDREEWRNREDLAPLAGVSELEAEEACLRFFACGLIVRRAAYPDYRYRLIALPDRMKTERGRILWEKLQAAMSAEAVV